MIKIYRADTLGKSDLGWLKSRFHFAFAQYLNRRKVHFGNLRVLNDDIISPNSGFEMHPHENMEIITYVVSGELTHQDSMGNKKLVKRGDVQYMSAGTGLNHSEYNYGQKPIRLLQIWIFPNQEDLPPRYGDKSFQWEDRINKLYKIVSSMQGDAAVKINQDANIYVSYLEAKQTLDLPSTPKRQAYFMQIEGSSILNTVNIYEGDSAELIDEDVQITAKGNSHFLIVELPK